MDYRRIGLPIFSVCALCLLSAACVREEKPNIATPDLLHMLPFGQVLEPKPDLAVTGPFSIRGWALSENGIQQVAIYEDRVFLANAKLGLSSPEAQKEQPNFPGSATAGFQFDAAPGIFPSGPHELTVQARSKTGAVRDLASWKISIGTPFGRIDVPEDGKVIGEPFFIGGWAVSDSGVDQVTVFVDGKFLGNSHVGVPRPDVKGIYPQARDAETSGWRVDCTPAMFTAGEHEISAQVRSKAGVTIELGKLKIVIIRG